MRTFIRGRALGTGPSRKRRPRLGGLGACAFTLPPPVV